MFLEFNSANEEYANIDLITLSDKAKNDYYLEVGQFSYPFQFQLPFPITHKL